MGDWFIIKLSREPEITDLRETHEVVGVYVQRMVRYSTRTYMVKN